MSTLDKEELSSDQATIQMMYEYSELMEELAEARTYFMGHLADLETEDFFNIPEEFSYSVAHCIGHLAYIEKELGKKADADFSFRLDAYDELFSDLEFPVQISELPKKAELLVYLEEVHDVFLEEIRYRKKSELIFILINQYYQHALKLGKILEGMGKAHIPQQPDSPRIKLRSEEGDLPLYHLPVYAN